MKYEQGDQVRIKSIEWYNKNKDITGDIRYKSGPRFSSNMKKYCGQTMTIRYVYSDAYRMEEDSSAYESGHFWTDEMIEGLMEEEVFIKANDIYNEEYSKGEYCHEQSFKWGFQEGYNYSHENDKLEISLKEGYIFKDENSNIINARKIVLEKKKKAYPKTYEECCKILDWNHRDYDRVGYKSELLCKLQVLLLCRDAYWKLHGDEMGLDGPWSPTDSDYITGRYCIFVHRGNIICDTPAQDCILTFPTEEMRDAFYESFKEEIEICKELL